MREREREEQRETESDRERQRQTRTDRGRKRQRETERGRQEEAERDNADINPSAARADRRARGFAEAPPTTPQEQQSS